MPALETRLVDPRPALGHVYVTDSIDRIPTLIAIDSNLMVDTFIANASPDECVYRYSSSIHRCTETNALKVSGLSSGTCLPRDHQGSRQHSPAPLAHA